MKNLDAVPHGLAVLGGLVLIATGCGGSNDGLGSSTGGIVGVTAGAGLNGGFGDGGGVGPDSGGSTDASADSGSTGDTGGLNGPGEGCGAVSEKADLQLQPTDVIWAIDTSGSMTASFPAIRQALVDFSSRVSGAGIDAHIILLAGGDLCVPAPLGSGACGGIIPGAAAADSNEPALLHLNLPFGYTEGMGTILNNYGAYAHLLRPGARTHLVLTEDGPPPVGADAVVDHIEGRASATGAAAWSPGLEPGSWVFHGVVCENGTGGGACLLALAPPTTTLELIDRTGGLSADLATAGAAGADPFSDLLDTLAERVVVGAELSCEFPIPTPSGSQALDENAVNVVLVDAAGTETLFPRVGADGNCGDATAWKYDVPDAPTQVELCPAACDAARQQAQARIDIQFGCETVTLF